VEDEEEEGGEEATGEQDISTNIRTHEKALHYIIELMQFAIDSSFFSLLNYCIQLRIHSKRHEHKQVETSFFVRSVEGISVSCILETCSSVR
jgi:hypothetical protein